MKFLTKDKQTNKERWISKTLTRAKSYFAAYDFPSTSFLVSEAHSQGAPFIHGIGIMFKPLMDENEERGIEDGYIGNTTQQERDSHTKGPDYYRHTTWNKATGWGDLILLK